MERVSILRWRRQQQLAKVHQFEQDSVNRERARLLRPLLAEHLPIWAAELCGSSTIEPVSAVPFDKIVGDQYSAIFEQPVRDYVTTKAFYLPSINALFLLLIDAQWLELTLITRHYRMRNAYRYFEAGGLWLPRGDYTRRTTLVVLDWQVLAPLAAVELLLAQALAQRPLILALADQASRDMLRRLWYIRLQGCMVYLGYGLAALAGWLLLTWLVLIIGHLGSGV